jgi:myosin heavy subunit
MILSHHKYTPTRGKYLIAINNNNYNNTNRRMNERTDNTCNNDSKENTISSSLQPPPPHIYAIAQNTYLSINTHQSTPNNHRIQKNQCILVSGESGAGKTVTTKIVLQYLARLSQQRQRHGIQSNIGIIWKCSHDTE